MDKVRPIYKEFNSKDKEAIFQCPCCENVFGSNELFRQQLNSNANNYCPQCKIEFEMRK